MNTMYLAEDLIAPGGPSAPVWAFLSTITVAMLGVIAQQISAKRAATEAKREAKEARNAAESAAESSAKASSNTTSISNGFAGSVVRKLDEIAAEQRRQANSLRQHYEWHLTKDTSDKESQG